MIELLFGGLIEPPKTPLIEYVIEQKIEIPPEPTLEEKIASDFYKCEPLRYIRADNAECGDVRPEYRASEGTNNAERRETPLSRENANTAPSGWFPKYQCTWYVWTKRPVGQWNNATDWYWQAQRDGYETGTTPAVGAIAWEYGHVLYVEAVDGGMVYVSERNYDNKGSYRESWQPANKYKYIY